jgi:hypothetical protein
MIAAFVLLATEWTSGNEIPPGIVLVSGLQRLTNRFPEN